MSMFKRLLKRVEKIFKKGKPLSVTRKPEYINSDQLRAIIDVVLFDMEINDITSLMGYFKTHNNIKVFLEALIYCESNYNVNSTYMEPAPLYYESCGLLQLSHNDMKYYNFCDISGDLIYNPYNNIMFGLGIMNKLISKKGTPIFNSGNYWSVLMPKNKEKHLKFLRKHAELYSELRKNHE